MSLYNLWLCEWCSFFRTFWHCYFLYFWCCIFW